MADNEKKEETVNQESGVATEYQFAEKAKLKECKYCCVMVPKKAKICPNCKTSLKKHWLRNLFIIIVLLALIALIVAGGYYFLYEYQAPIETAGVIEEITEVAETVDEEETKAEEAASEESKENVTETTVSEPETEVGESDNEEMADTLAIIDIQETTEESELEENEAGATVVELTECTVSEEDICGADGPILDYANEKIIIFHDYCGMFVYDIEAEEITAAFDLAAIGCQDTQGDSACIVSVTDDGSTVYLHPSNTKEMYVYDVAKNLLTKKSYSMKDAGELCKLQITSDYVEPDSTVFRTYYCADLKDNTYLYLESGSGLIADMCYVVEQDGKQIEYVSLFDNYFMQKTKEDVSEADKEKAGEEVNEAVNKDEKNNKEGYKQISYKEMLRQQEEYKDTELVLEVTVMAQVDGGLFDDNVYFLCVGTDEQGIERYYIIRDDRAEEELLILEGDVLRIQGTLFDRCKLSADLVKTQPTVPALAMSACELVEE